MCSGVIGVQSVVCLFVAGGQLCSFVVLECRELSVSVLRAVYFVALWEWNTECGISVCSLGCIVQLCGFGVQKVVCHCVGGFVFRSFLVLECREGPFSVYPAVYCLALWYWSAESDLSVCSFFFIV
jgi:hypothetical protein